MADYDVETELAALQFVLWVLIEAHPDKRELLQRFDRTASEHQFAGLIAGGNGLSEALRASLNKYRAHIAGSV
jgi:hypothetical protein